VRARNDYGETPLQNAERVRAWACVSLVWRAKVLRAERGVAVGAPLPLAWTAGTHARFEDEERRAVESALRALLLAEERRAGCALGEDAVTAVLRAVAS
jgi:hypothetical protein